jgi:hypothetical protein
MSLLEIGSINLFTTKETKGHEGKNQKNFVLLRDPLWLIDLHNRFLRLDHFCLQLPCGEFL